MKNNTYQNHIRKLVKGTAFFMLVGAVFTGNDIIGEALAQSGHNSSPLVVTNKPLPTALEDKLYRPTGPAPQIAPGDISGSSYFQSEPETPVGRKANELRNELFDLQRTVANLSERLANLEQKGQRLAAEYYASVATISTQLQSGTTPGNPRLLNRLSTATGNLDRLNGNLIALNELAVDVSNAASMADYILNSARSAFTITGAVEEDHVRLKQLEDAANKVLVSVDRLASSINDDITRTTAYLNTERQNLRTLSLAITTGDLFGGNLANRAFGNAGPTFAPRTKPIQSRGATGISPSGAKPSTPAFSGTRGPGIVDGSANAAPGSMRPLVMIRFDKASVDYEQPVYMAVNEALTRYPDARFELVAVHPSQGNAAQVAIESTKSRRNAEKVLRSLAQMGLPMDRIELSYTPSAQADTSEVHIYVR